MTAKDVLTKVAKAQGALWKFTQVIMRDDKSDGICLTKLTEAHREVYFKVKEELERVFGYTAEELEAIDKMAGEQ